jgi:uncharacterized protein (TIGR02145 family)
MKYLCTLISIYASVIVFSQQTKPAPSIKDIDGNTYKTVFIGTQQWMTENLRTSKYNDGTIIQNLKNSLDWHECHIGSWVNYRNDKSYNLKYGKLYSWHTVNSSWNNNKNVCPNGWRVPTLEDFDILISYLGGYEIAGQKMKEIEGKGGWKKNYNSNSKYNSLFFGLPGGGRIFDGTTTDFGYLGTYGYYWTSNEDGYSTGWSILLKYDSDEVEKRFLYKHYGLSIRCLNSNPKTAEIKNEKNNIQPNKIESYQNFSQKKKSTKIIKNNTIIQKKKISNTPNQLSIGQDYQGGKIYYILKHGDKGYDPKILHGLIVAPYDQSTGSNWGCLNKVVQGAEKLEIGFGDQNTLDILNSCNEEGTAARICSDLVLNGFDDWYLPSLEELRSIIFYIISNPNTNNLGFLDYTYYWTSTKCDNNRTYAFLSYYNGPGGENGAGIDSEREQECFVRAIRKF